jgi:hypothetical protein
MSTPQVSKDLKYLDEQYDLMVTSSIRRSEQGKRSVFKFYIRADDLKRETGRDRLRQETIDYVVDYFKSARCQVEYHDKHQTFYITFDLGTARLTLSQAQLLNEEWKKK